MKSYTAIIWTIVILIVFDVCLNIATQYPASAKDMDTISELQRYFNYGKSIEWKVRWMTGKDDEHTADLMKSGWLVDHQERKDTIEPGRERLVAVYGMSFSARVALAMEKLDKRVTARISGGPGATVTRSYADYMLDRGNHQADVVVLGILASSIETGGTVTHMTSNFEAPSAHTYPKFYLKNNQLQRLPNPANSLTQFRMLLDNAEAWEQFVEFLATNDPYYDAFSFNQDIWDASVIGRLIRRAWAQRQYREQAAKYYNSADGFTNYHNSISITQKIIETMAEQTAADDQTFIVLLINNLGYSDHLYQALHRSLDAQAINYLSTHSVVSPDEYANFIPDGHFRPEFDEAIAAELSTMIFAQH